jgi:hypothetical protein
MADIENTRKPRPAGASGPAIIVPNKNLGIMRKEGSMEEEDREKAKANRDERD